MKEKLYPNPNPDSETWEENVNKKSERINSFNKSRNKKKQIFKILSRKKWEIQTDLKQKQKLQKTLFTVDSFDNNGWTSTLTTFTITGSGLIAVPIRSGIRRGVGKLLD